MNIPFQTIDWVAVPKTEHPGETGTSFWQTLQLPGLRVRIVEYGAGYLADHWCQKGHIVYCIEGAFETEMEGGQSFILSKGMSYVVSDGLSSHRSVSKHGVKLLIVDGDFLKTESLP
ncbi:DHCW motif cupin fold protein [uncultured Imperialibacter sp.]|uniref:DHCW motif cupin fold protein n=1 Tax=uncultured Imperialibacter sp. TaxID=1672639 RepID=UPI0030D6CEFC|tara:strand:+ start:2460 stop:2810 length:351 start_codon:yes stop_codon:yes gene_type:complete